MARSRSSPHKEKIRHMDTTTKPTQPTKTRRQAATPEKVLKDAVAVSSEIKAAADFTDLGKAVDYAMTIADPAEREAYFADLKPLRDITAFDFYGRVKRPFAKMQAASAAGKPAEAAKAADDVAKGLADFAEISPEFKKYVGGLEDRIVKLEQAVEALQTNDKVQDKRLDDLEDVVARMLRGQFVDVANLPWEKGGAKAPAPQPVVPPKAPQATTDAQSRAAAHGTSDDDTEEPKPIGFFAKIARAFRLGAGGDEDNASKSDGYPYPGTYAGPIEEPTPDHGNRPAGAKALPGEAPPTTPPAAVTAAELTDRLRNPAPPALATSAEVIPPPDAPPDTAPDAALLPAPPVPLEVAPAPPATVPYCPAPPAAPAPLPPAPPDADAAVLYTPTPAATSNEDPMPGLPATPFVSLVVTAAPPAPPAPTVTVTVAGSREAGNDLVVNPPPPPPAPPVHTVPTAPRRPDPPPPPPPIVVTSTSTAPEGLVQVPDAVNMSTCGGKESVLQAVSYEVPLALANT